MHVSGIFLPHMTGDNHKHQQSAHCSLISIWIILRHCAILQLWWWDFSSNWKGDGTARRALLKAVSKFSSERGPLVPTQILWKQFCTNISFLFFLSRINTFVFDIKCTKILYSGHFSAKHTCYSMPNLVEKIVRKECMSESPNNSQHANEKCNW